MIDKEDIKELQEMVDQTWDMIDDLVDSIDDLNSDRENAHCSCGDRTNERTERVNMSVPAPGEQSGESEVVEIDLIEETYTEEVPVEGGDNPETMRVERTRRHRPVEWTYAHKPHLLDEETRENSEYVNTRDVDEDTIPAPGQRESGE